MKVEDKLLSSPESKLREVNLIEMHYHLKKGGVRTVIENSVEALVTYANSDSLNISVIAGLGADRLDTRRHLKDSGGKNIGISYIDFPELGYSDRIFPNREIFLEQANGLKDKLLQVLQVEKYSPSNPLVLHIHNFSLGKNAVASAAVKLFTQESCERKYPVWVLYHIHDFAENSRPDRLYALQHCTGRLDKEFASFIMYPNERNVFYLVLNSSDYENVLELGISPKRVYLIPNSVNVEFFSSVPITTREKFKKQLVERIEEYAQSNGYEFDGSRKILLSPLRIMLRKNNLESILLLEVFNRINCDQYGLVITLDADSPNHILYSKKLKEFIKENSLPVVIGVGEELISKDYSRVKRGERVEAFNLVDLLHISDAIITTSVLEGFGFMYVEGWLANKLVVGRKIPYACDSFEANGMRLDHLYTRIAVDVKWVSGGAGRIVREYLKKINDLRKAYGLGTFSLKKIEREVRKKKFFKKKDRICIDFSDLSLEMQEEVFLKIRNDGKIFSEFLGLNPKIKQTAKLIKSKNTGLINRNKRVVEEKYSLNAMAKRLVNAIAIGNSNYRKNIMGRRVDNGKLIKKFLDMKAVKLLY